VERVSSAGPAGTTMARVSFRPGLDVADLAVVADDGTTLAHGTWRATSVSPGPEAWDAALVKLGFRRTGDRWQATGTGFEVDVERREGDAVTDNRDRWDDIDRQTTTEEWDELERQGLERPVARLEELQKLVEEARANKEGDDA
jgi:hypothetical protein